MNIMIEDLVKDYGKKRALDRVSLTIQNGMFGLLGANGSGKTTLIRILATLLTKSEGRVTIDGIPIENRRKIREIIGYLPQEFNMYPYFTVYESLDYIGCLSGIKEGRDQRIKDMLEYVNLQDSGKLKVKTLSGGMKRRLGIAIALINNPRLLIADEPTAGLDPEERIRFRNLLHTFSKDRTVLFSTHIASDIEASCDNIAVLNYGKVLFCGNMKEFLKSAEGVVWEISGNNEDMEKYYDTESGKVVISETYNGEKTTIRLYSPEKPYENAIPVLPKAEDAYIGIVNRSEEKADG